MVADTNVEYWGTKSGEAQRLRRLFSQSRWLHLGVAAMVEAAMVEAAERSVRLPRFKLLSIRLVRGMYRPAESIGSPQELLRSNYF